MKKMAVLSLILVLAASSVEATIPADIQAVEQKEQILKGDENPDKTDVKKDKKVESVSVKKPKKDKKVEKPTIEQTLYSKDQQAESMTEAELEEELYCDSLEELAICVMAEAGNQGIDGMRMVADVILNRVDDPDFPDTIHGVISQQYHFRSYWDGGMQRWSTPSGDCYKAVQMELQSRSYPGLMYFCTGGYSQYGTPAFQHGEHYFSTK